MRDWPQSGRRYPRVLFLGGNNGFSSVMLQALRTADVQISAVVSHGFAGAPPPADGRFCIAPPSRPAVLAHCAEALDLKVVFVHDLSCDTTLRQVDAAGVDIVLSVCFPRRLPGPWRALPALACLNLHPSLLPAYRGPAPVFWQYRAGERYLGVTLHELTAELDAGPVLARRAVPILDGLRHHEIDMALGRAGAGLIAETLPGLHAATVRSEPQDPHSASHQPPPRPADFELSASWSARRAFNFMRATEHYCQPYTMGVDGRLLSLRRAVSFSREHSNAVLGGLTPIAFQSGSLYAEPAVSDSNPSRAAL